VNDMQADHEIPAELAGRLRAAIARRVDRVSAQISMLAESEGTITPAPEFRTAILAQQAVIDAQREELLRWRDSGRLPDESLRQLQLELDLEERGLPEG
jgi:monovalent cation/hydrogen antiporter